MDTSYQRNKDSQEWYTPKWIIDALGLFDLDPCAPIEPPYKIAEHTFNITTDGLSQNWGGYGDVWLNPPYRHPLVDSFVAKMIAHNNGIALLFDRCDVAMWQKKIFPTASALMFMSGRVKFMQPDGTTKQGAGCGSILIAWGKDCAERLRKSKIDGFFIDLQNQKKI